jgi:hypothetical protein
MRVSEVVGDEGGGVGDVEDEVVDRLEQRLEAGGDVRRREHAAHVQRREQHRDHLALAPRLVHRESHGALDDVRVELRCVELEDAARGLEEVAAAEVLAHCATARTALALTARAWCVRRGGEASEHARLRSIADLKSSSVVALAPLEAESTASSCTTSATPPHSAIHTFRAPVLLAAFPSGPSGRRSAVGSSPGTSWWNCASGTVRPLRLGVDGISRFG